MLKRTFDIVFSFLLLVLLLPIFIIISLMIIIESRGGAIFRQQRIGKNEKLFTLYKFRSMYKLSSNQMLLTASNDIRITKIGKYIRKTKIDELPQLFNILKGDMSFVGPRPEVPKYVQFYNNEQRKVLTVRPGLTDFATIYYFNESDELAKTEDPEQYYIQNILPKKIELSLMYIQKQSFFTDIYIIFMTIVKILKIK